MSTDLLNTLVTSAIWRAERLEEYGVGSAPLAWAEVSDLEEELAKVLPASHPEGRIARRGAVRAALAARQLGRAQQLADRFLAEAEASDELKASLRKLFEETADSTARRFPHVDMSAVRGLVRARSEQGAPFPIG